MSATTSILPNIADAPADALTATLEAIRAELARRAKSRAKSADPGASSIVRWSAPGSNRPDVKVWARAVTLIEPSRGGYGVAGSWIRINPGASSKVAAGTPVLLGATVPDGTAWGRKVNAVAVADPGYVDPLTVDGVAFALSGLRPVPNDGPAPEDRPELSGCSSPRWAEVFARLLDLGVPVGRVPR